MASGAVSAYAAADLSITKGGAGGVKPGESVVYTIVVTNGGPDAAADVTVTDGTPDGLSFVSNAGDCATAFPCSLGTIASGQSRTITATFSVPASYHDPNPIVNVATVSTSSPDSDSSDDSATAFTALTRVAGFHTLPPCRVADTRGTTGVPIGGPSLQAGASRNFPVRRLCGLPDNAIAVSFNVTVTGPTGAGDLRIHPGGTSLPPASAINYISGQTRANNGIVPLGTDGSIALQCDQASGTAEAILDVNGYFASTDAVATPFGQSVRVRPAPEVEITFDNVTQAGVTSARVIEFPDNRPGAIDQDLRDFFPVGSPLRALLPSVVVPAYIEPLGKGSATGDPTFILAVIDTTAKFTRTAEIHGLEDFILGWDPPCLNASDPTQEPRTFYAREVPKGEPALVEESAFGGPVFVDISSGCGSNKGSGWNFSLYLTAKDTRTPRDIAQFMLLRMRDALATFALSITNPTVASGLAADAQAALATLDSNPASSVAKMSAFVARVDANPAAFDNSARNVSGELAARALSAIYMLQKLAPPFVNAAPNPSFEVGGAAQPDGWVGLGGAQFTWSSTEFHTGIRSVCIGGFPANTSGEWYTVSNLPVEVGQSYRFGAWVKGSSDREANVAVFPKDANGAFLTGYAIGVPYNSTSWTYGEGIYTASPDARSVLLALEYNNPGAFTDTFICFDDVLWGALSPPAPVKPAGR